MRARGETSRKVNMVVALAEYYLGRPISNVLDIGCGEGVWRAPLLKLRPGITYLGLDSSEYAIRRFGRSRNLHMAQFTDLAELRFDRRFDVIRRLHFRNTALRFKFNMLQQRYNTFTMYWLRICRQIEDGTYQRHLNKAKARAESEKKTRGNPVAVK